MCHRSLINNRDSSSCGRFIMGFCAEGSTVLVPDCLHQSLKIAGGHDCFQTLTAINLAKSLFFVYIIFSKLTNSFFEMKVGGQ